jgi:hypothetical protein
MPKKARSHAFIPRRRKEGEDAVPGPLARYISVNREDIEGLFHLPLKDAAREIGLCPTTFKKACRMFHIEHWPPQKAQRQALIARTDAHADAFDADITAQHQEPVCALRPPPAAAVPGLRTPPAVTAAVATDASRQREYGVTPLLPPGRQRRRTKINPLLEPFSKMAPITLSVVSFLLLVLIAQAGK